jgi:hypothetical protein
MGSGNMVADSTRGRIYVSASTNSGQVIYVIDDTSTIRTLATRGY